MGLLGTENGPEPNEPAVARIWSTSLADDSQANLVQSASLTWSGSRDRDRLSGKQSVASGNWMTSASAARACRISSTDLGTCVLERVDISGVRPERGLSHGQAQSCG